MLQIVTKTGDATSWSLLHFRREARTGLCLPDEHHPRPRTPAPHYIIRLHVMLNEILTQAPCYLHVNCLANAKRQCLNNEKPQPRRQRGDKPHAPLRGLQEHTCEYCSSFLLSDRFSTNEHSDLTTLDLGYVESAYQSHCALYVSLVDRLAEAGHALNDLIPCPTLYQDWDTARYQDGRHLTIHLARGKERFCDGVAYRLYSEDSTGHYSHGEYVVALERTQS